MRVAGSGTHAAGCYTATTISLLAGMVVAASGVGATVQRLFWALLLIVALFGSSYGAVVINRAMGPWTATLGEADGSVSQVSFDPNMAPADFVPLFPGA